MTNITQESIKGNLPMLADDSLDRQSTHFTPHVSDEPFSYGETHPSNYTGTYQRSREGAVDIIKQKRAEQLKKAESRGRIVGWFVTAKQVLFDKYKDDERASNYAQAATRGMINPSRGRHSSRIEVQGAHRAVLPERTEFSFSKLATPGRHELKTGSHRAPNRLAVAAQAGLTAVRAAVVWLKTPNPEMPGQLVPLRGLFDVHDKTMEIPVVR